MNPYLTVILIPSAIVLLVAANFGLAHVFVVLIMYAFGPTRNRR